MTRIAWGAADQRGFEQGADQGVLFPMVAGVYQDGVPWNGLTTVTESPEGAEATPFYADNRKYANLTSAEEYNFTIEAFFSPPQFDACDGTVDIAPGASISQQDRQLFGFSWRTKVGNSANPNAGFKYHFVYNALAAPTERAHATINDTPELDTLSWDCSTTKVDVGTIGGTTYLPTAKLTVDSTETDPVKLANLLDIVYGNAGANARMPLPNEVAAVVGAAVTVVNMNLAANTPTFVEGTGVLTLPTVTGVQWKVNGVNKAPGAQPAIASGQSITVTAVPSGNGYSLSGDTDRAFTRP